MSMGGVGPYINDDGDVWVPRTVPYLEARRLAKLEMAYDTDRLVYEGKKDAYLYGYTRDCDCDSGCIAGTDDEPDLDDDTCLVPCWYFRIIEP